MQLKLDLQQEMQLIELWVAKFACAGVVNQFTDLSPQTPQQWLDSLLYEHLEFFFVEINKPGLEFREKSLMASIKVMVDFFLPRAREKFDQCDLLENSSRLPADTLEIFETMWADFQKGKFPRLTAKRKAVIEAYHSLCPHDEEIFTRPFNIYQQSKRHLRLENFHEALMEEIHNYGPGQLTATAEECDEACKQAYAALILADRDRIYPIMQQQCQK